MERRPDSDIVTAFHRLHATVMCRVFPHMARFLKGQELSFQHFVVMFKIRLAGPQSIAALANEVELTQTAASRMIDRLVKAGLLDRTENPVDRRQKLITLTERGRVLLAELPAITMKSYDDLLSSVPHDLIARLRGPMEEVTDRLPPFPEFLNETDVPLADSGPDMSRPQIANGDRAGRNAAAGPPEN